MDIINSVIEGRANHPYQQYARTFADRVSKSDRQHEILCFLACFLDGAPDKEALVLTTCRSLDVFEKKRAASIACSEFKLPKLTTAEIERVGAMENYSHISSFIQTRSLGISGEYRARVALLEKAGDISNLHGRINDFKLAFQSFIKDDVLFGMYISNLDYIKTAIPLVFKPYETKKKPTRKRAKSITALPDGQYVSIDIKSANFSVLYHFIGPVILKMLPNIEYETWESMCAQFSKDELMYSMKRLRCCLINEAHPAASNQIQATMTSIIRFMDGVLLDLSCESAVLTYDEIIIEEDRLDADTIKSMMKLVQNVIGKSMANKMKIEHFELKTVHLPSGKRFRLKNEMPVGLSPEMAFEYISN